MGPALLFSRRRCGAGYGNGLDLLTCGTFETFETSGTRKKRKILGDREDEDEGEDEGELRLAFEISDYGGVS